MPSRPDFLHARDFGFGSQRFEAAFHGFVASFGREIGFDLALRYARFARSAGGFSFNRAM
jgi:hypothetical protein